MARGDQIYVMRPFVGLNGVYEHHGIDCGDGTVIHYQKTDVATIRRTSMATFAAGNPVFLKRQPVSYIPDLVLERAESRLGEQRYNLLTNNCEHFANWCKTGGNESEQLAGFGLDVSQFTPEAANQLIAEAAQGGDIVKAKALMDRAHRNIAIAQTQLQSQYEQADQEMHTWHRVAQLALKQGKEAIARAALERKVKFRRKAADLQNQLEQLTQIELSLNRNQPQIQSNTNQI